MTIPTLSDNSDPNHRRYRNPERPGVLYDSVTWAIGTGVPKWGLIHARQKLIAHEAWSNFSKFANRPEAEAVAYLMATPEREWGTARDRGNAVHDLAEMLGKGQTPSVWDEELVPYLWALRDFFEDWRPRFDHVELTLYNDELCYAGTADWLGRVDSMPDLGVVIADWKTGRDIYPEAALQLAAYAHCTYGIGPNGVVELPPVESAMLVHLTPERYRVAVIDLDESQRPSGEDSLFEVFCGALAVARFASWGRQVLNFVEAGAPAHGWDVAGIIAAIERLSLEDKMTLSQAFIDQGIPTVPAQWTEAHVDLVFALLDKVGRSFPNRPMP